MAEDKPNPKGKGLPKGGKQQGGKKKLTRKKTEPITDEQIENWVYREPDGAGRTRR